MYGTFCSLVSKYPTVMFSSTCTVANSREHQSARPLCLKPGLQVRHLGELRREVPVVLQEEGFVAVCDQQVVRAAPALEVRRSQQRVGCGVLHLPKGCAPAGVVGRLPPLLIAVVQACARCVSGKCTASQQLLCYLQQLRLAQLCRCMSQLVCLATRLLQAAAM